MLTRGSLPTPSLCYDPKKDRKRCPRDLRLRTHKEGLGNLTASMVRNPAACLLPLLVRVTPKQYVHRSHNPDC